MGVDNTKSFLISRITIKYPYDIYFTLNKYPSTENKIG